VETGEGRTAGPSEAGGSDMPTYEYQCRKCGHEFEREQRIVEDPIKRCPACKSNQARRLISKTSFVLKGSGWYNDLYSSAKPETSAGDAKGEKSEKSDKPEKSESKGDSKGESKSDSKKSDSGKKSSAKKSAA
jgi:putative FmdB family regulatory protein